ncbi:MAG: SpoIIIAH-like family protein [Ruminococcus sp.]|jgi:stage III sporulation protein AH|nr:SpoIIIAH-like family protein [Ruminococcus sp.]
MRKPTIIIGKKHIILACLTLILGIAIYINYVFASGNTEGIVDTGAADESGASAVLVSADEKNTGNYGDTEFVNAELSASDAEAGTDYFSQVRLTKMTSRDDAAEQLSAILGGGDLSSEEIATYTGAAVDLSSLAETESMIENLIKAQGFDDCVVYLTDDTANIVVKTSGLLPAQAAQIKDILLGEVTVPTENIRIFEVK